MTRIKQAISGLNIEQQREYARRCALSVAHVWGASPNVKDHLETGKASSSYAAQVAADYAAVRARRRATEYTTGSAAWNRADATKKAAWSTRAAIMAGRETEPLLVEDLTYSVAFTVAHVLAIVEEMVPEIAEATLWKILLEVEMGERK